MLRPFLNTAISISRTAGQLLLEGMRNCEALYSRKKETMDFAIETTQMINQKITELLQRAYPDHACLSSEKILDSSEVSIKDSDYVWLINGLDGIINFAHRISNVAISLALRHQKELQIGVVFDPIKGDLFTAIRGEGAQENNARIRVNNLMRRDIVIGINSITGINRLLAQYPDAHFRITGVGSRDLADLAAGRSDGFYFYENNSAERKNVAQVDGIPVELAAGILLVKEAGGLVHNPLCSEASGVEVVAGTTKVFKQLCKVDECLSNSVKHAVQNQGDHMKTTYEETSQVRPKSAPEGVDAYSSANGIDKSPMYKSSSVYAADKTPEGPSSGGYYSNTRTPERSGAPSNFSRGGYGGGERYGQSDRPRTAPYGRPQYDRSPGYGASSGGYRGGNTPGSSAPYERSYGGSRPPRPFSRPSSPYSRDSRSSYAGAGRGRSSEFRPSGHYSSRMDRPMHSRHPYTPDSGGPHAPSHYNQGQGWAPRMRRREFGSRPVSRRPHDQMSGHYAGRHPMHDEREPS